jgi:protein TonB
MISKKNPKIDLEKYRVHFFLIGLILSLLAVIYLFNIRFYDEEIEAPQTIIIDGDEIVIPITKREPPKMNSAPIKDLPSQLDIIDDDKIVSDELDMSATETDENEFLSDVDIRYIEGNGEIEIISQEEEVLEELEDPIPFALVESVPVFPGCEDLSSNDERKDCFQKKLLEFVGANFNYSETARQLRIQGRVIIQFVIEKNGQVSSPLILRGVDPWLDNEAIRVISALPYIKPASQRGRNVRMSFVVPISLQLAD